MPTRTDLPHARRASLDTCVLVYAIDTSQGRRFDASQALLERALRESWPVALQVLGEFYSVATRKKMLARGDAARTVREWSALLTPIAASTAAFAQALGYAARSGAHFWDALILATCAEHDVKTLYTEDIGPQRNALGVALTSPFAAAR